MNIHHSLLLSFYCLFYDALAFTPQIEGSRQYSSKLYTSVAEEWAKEQKAQDSRKKYVVIGGGWGGWGSAQALCEQTEVDCDVYLLDALPDPTGSMPYLSGSGKPVEAGTRGFWKDYPNINKLCQQLGIDEDDVFTPFTNSSFYSPDGLEATAPVFQRQIRLENLVKIFRLVFLSTMMNRFHNFHLLLVKYWRHFLYSNAFLCQIELQ